MKTIGPTYQILLNSFFELTKNKSNKPKSDQPKLDSNGANKYPNYTLFSRNWNNSGESSQALKKFNFSLNTTNKKKKPRTHGTCGTNKNLHKNFSWKKIQPAKRWNQIDQTEIAAIKQLYATTATQSVKIK